MNSHYNMTLEVHKPSDLEFKNHSIFEILFQEEG